MRVVEVSAYPQELAKKMSAAQKQITLASLTLLYDEHTKVVLDELAAAVERGVVVKIVVDAFSRFLLGQEPKLWEMPGMQRRIWQTTAFLQELEQRGAIVWLHDGMGWNPFKGRFHQKITRIDDDVYFAGGVNMTAAGLSHVDYMLHTTDARLATMLEAQLADIIAAPFIDDSEHEINHHSRLLIDGGKPGVSLIYDRALELAEKADRVMFVSQMCPSGKLALLLRQKDSVFFYNPPQFMMPPANVYQWAQQVYYRLKNSYRRQQFLHAKLMLFELPGGKKAVLSGSHNFSWRGVAYGTRELAVESYDEEIWHNLHDFVRRSVSPEK